jgi:hypothetical protein
MSGPLAFWAVLSGVLGVGGKSGVFHRPYSESATNLIYNLLFCDDPALFRATDGKEIGSLGVVSSAHPTNEALKKIADDESEETRVRIVAYNRLRVAKVAVPKGRVLGVVVEVGMEGGLDTLAVYADGRMRYINHTGKMSIMEPAPAELKASGDDVLKAAQAAAAMIGPWEKKRLPAPKQGNGRLTFLVTDGLYFGQGPQDKIAGDAIGGPVLMAAAQLLTAIVDASVAR